MDDQKSKPKAIRRPAKTRSKPKARRFVPRPCGSCEAIRPKGENYSKVIGSPGKVRYCRCGFCGHSWTETKKIQQDSMAMEET